MAKKLFSLVAAFALLFTACDTAEVGEIHAETDTINLDAGGQCTSIKYVIDKAVEGAKVTATSDVEWFHVSSVDEEACQISYCCDPNTSSETRKGTLTIKYAGDTAKVTINQAGVTAAE